jgi:hypothetical protein
MSDSKSSPTFVADYSQEEIDKAHQVLYNEGLRMRIKVAGKDYVEKSLNAAKDPFSKPMQEVRHSLSSVAGSILIILFAVRSRSLLGLGVVSSWPGTQNSLLPQHRHALLPKSLD